jgi:hypothetical protein
MACGALATGCSFAPSVEIVGSFFPAWLVCLVIAVVLTVPARWMLVRANLEKDVGPLVVFYPCLVLLFTCVSWLVLF